MPTPLQPSMLQLIRETSENPNRHAVPTPVTNYMMLVNAIIQKDLTDEMAKLQAMTRLDHIEAVKEQFSVLCRTRAEQNHGSFIHFSSNPHSLCNTLYFNMAKLLYPEASFQELVKLLLPDITTLWHVDLKQNIKTHGKLGKRRKIEALPDLSKTTVDDIKNPMASMPVELNSFNQLVFSDHSVFPLSETANFNLELHQQFHHLASSDENGRLLLQAIQQHNPEIGALYNFITFLNGSAASLHDTLLRMALAGERFNNSFYATEEGSRAAEEFLHYYAILSPKQQTQLNNCTNGNGKPFSNVIELIRAGECIEEVSKLTLEILTNPVNQAVLTTRPKLNEQNEANLVELYRLPPGEILVNLDHESTLTILPARLSQYFYHQIIINDIDELLCYLTEFPPKTYAFLASEATINFDVTTELGTIWPSLDDIKRQGLLDALIQEKNKLGVANVLVTFISVGEMHAIEKLFESLTADKVFSVLQDNNYVALFLAAQFSPTAIEIILNKLSKPQCAALILNKVGADNHSLLYWAATQNTQSLEIMLSRLSEAQIQEALDEENEQSCLSELLTSTAKDNAASFELLLDHLPRERQHLHMIQKRNFMNHSTILFSAVPNPVSLQIILSMYPENERRAALEEAVIHRDEKSVLKKIALYAGRNKNPECMIAALSSLPQHQRLPVLIATVARRERNSLHLMATDPIGLEQILLLLPEHQRRPALLAKDSNGVNVLEMASENSESVAVIEELCPKERRNPLQSNIMALIGITRKQHRDHHLLPTSIMNFPMLLNAIHQKELTDNMKNLRQIITAQPSSRGAFDKRSQATGSEHHSGDPSQARDDVHSVAEQFQQRVELNDLEAIREQFLTLCRTREELNHGSPLHFTASPDSPCNTLYVSMAELLYPDATVEERCQLLQPEITPSGHDVDLNSNLDTRAFITKLSPDFYPKIVIIDLEGLTGFLENISTTKYSHFLETVTIYFDIPSNLGTLCTDLDLTDYLALLDALIQTKNQWGVANLLATFINRNENEAIEQLLAPLSAEEIIAALLAENETGTSVLTNLIEQAREDNSPEAMIIVLRSQPEHQRLPLLIAAITVENKQNILHLMADQPTSLAELLQLLPEHDRETALLTEDAYGQTVRELVEDDPDTLAILNELCPMRAASPTSRAATPNPHALFTRKPAGEKETKNDEPELNKTPQ